jgi:hypothetical protein
VAATFVGSIVIDRRTLLNMGARLSDVDVDADGRAAAFN